MLSSALNQTKGKTLEEISKIVTDINQKLKERKNKLAPQIKQLRTVRNQYQEKESVYLEKKGMFESTAAGLESERVKLELQCGRNQDEALKVEREYHMLNCMLQKALNDKVVVNRCVLDSVLWFHLECPKWANKYDDPIEFKRKWRDFFSQIKSTHEAVTARTKTSELMQNMYGYQSAYPEDIQNYT